MTIHTLTSPLVGTLKYTSAIGLLGLFALTLSISPNAAAAESASGYQQATNSSSYASKHRTEYRRDKYDMRQGNRDQRRGDRDQRKRDRGHRRDHREHRRDTRDHRRDHREHRRDGDHRRDYRRNRHDHWNRRNYRRGHNWSNWHWNNRNSWNSRSRPWYYNRFNYRPIRRHGWSSRGYRTNYRSRIGINFVFGTPGYSRYRWAPSRYAFYRPGYWSYSSYTAQTHCERVVVEANHHGHRELISVVECHNPYDGTYLVQGSEQLIECTYGGRAVYYD